MRKHLWILAAVGVLLLAGGFLTWSAKTAPTPNAVKTTVMPRLIVTKTRTRNVYDGSTKVGELTFSIQKDTTLNTIKIVTDSLVFEVTNNSYKTDQSPLPTTENISLAEATSPLYNLETVTEEAGGYIGSQGDGGSCWFAVAWCAMDDEAGWTWNTFFTDPLDYDDTRLWVFYRNENRVSQVSPTDLVQAFIVKEEA